MSYAYFSPSLYRGSFTEYGTGATLTIPSPYGGLNLRDDITALKKNEARELINFFPSTGFVSARPGLTSFCSSLSPSSVLRLASFHTTTSQKLVAFTASNVYNVTTGTASSLLGSQTSGQTQYVNYKDRLFWVNGADAPRDWDGTTLTATSWSGSGLTITNLVNIAIVRDRLWFCENNQSHVWYAGIASVTGVLTKFDISQIAEGGKCMAIGSYSRDAGDGIDDYTVFVMDTGQVLVYSGDVSTTFSLVGKYRAAPPIGRRCLVKIGGELAIITRMGIVPVSSVVQGLDIGNQDPWGKVAPAIAADAKNHASKNGWCGYVHNGVLYINVPLSTTISKQYVLNLRNGAWTTYSSINAGDFASYDGDLYIGRLSEGVVHLHDGETDNGSRIVAQSRGAFIVPQKSYRTNLFTLARPKIKASGTVTGSISVDTDYFETGITGESVSLVDEVADSPWNTSAWNDTPWASPREPSQDWVSIRGDGRAVAVKLKLYAESNDLDWLATDIIFKPGGIR